MRVIAHVDDDKDFLAIFLRFMRRFPAVRVVSFTSFEAFLGSDLEFDAVLADLNVAPHFGITALNVAQSKGAPVYVFSGLGNHNVPSMHELYSGQGAQGFIPKDGYEENPVLLDLLKESEGV